MMTAEAAIQPDRQTLKRHIERISARWHEIGQPVVMEFRMLAEKKTPNVTRFDVSDQFFLDEAVNHVVAMNKAGLNAYAVVNPVDPDRVKPGKNATDEDIVAAFFQWIDCDTPEQAEYARNFAGPKRAFAVITGTIPHTRPHLYWELEQPQTDLKAFRALQIALAAHMQSDGSVINPSRIMRLAGTITYPDTKKQAKGWVSEVTKFSEKVSGPPVNVQRLTSLFPDNPKPPPGSSGTGFQFDPGAGEPLDRALAAANIEAGDQWHNNVVKLVGSYVSRGLTDAEIHAITDGFTQDGYGVEQTREEVQRAIDGAREKGWAPEPQEDALEPEFDSSSTGAEPEPEAVKPVPFTPWKTMDLSAIPRVRFVYSDFYARGYTSLTIAPPKVGKSMLGLAEALDMATGKGFLTGVEREPLKVVYFNAEDDQNVVNNRVAALLARYGIAQSQIEGRLFAQSGVDWNNFYFAAGDEGVICEKIFEMIEAFIVEQGADVLIFDPLQDISDAPESNDVFRRIGRRLRKMASATGVAIGIVHHTRKIAPGVDISMEDARGGSALRGTARFNRALSPMTEVEGASAGLSNYRHFLRIGDVESNLAPPSSDINRWYQKVSVETPNGEHVGAIEPWSWPDAFSGVTREHAKRVRDLLERRENPPKWHFNSKDWVGLMVADVIGMNAASAAERAKIKTILAKWEETEIIEVVDIRDPAKARDVKVVLAGRNNPMEENIS